MVKQIWYYSKNNEIRRDDVCIDYAGGLSGANKTNKIITYPCHGEKGNQEWIYTDVRKIIKIILKVVIEN